MPALLDGRLDVLRQLETERNQPDSQARFVRINRRGNLQFRFVRLDERSNVLVLKRGPRLLFVPLDFVLSSVREEQPHSIIVRVWVTPLAFSAIVVPALSGAAAIAS